MSTCFIFAASCTEEGCLSLCLDGQYQTSVPLAHRSFKALKQLQKNRRTLLVFPAQRFNFYNVLLPQKVNEKTARAAIPFALEEQLAQNITVFHFAFDRAFYKEGQYQVVVTEKEYLKQFCMMLSTNELTWDAMTVDWFALNEKEMAVTDKTVLVRDTAFQGVLDEDLASFYWKKLSLSREGQSVYHFVNSDSHLWACCEKAAKEAWGRKDPPLKESSEADALAALDSIQPVTAGKLIFETLEVDSYVWIAQRIAQGKFIDLCQGEFEVGTAFTRLKRWYQLAGGIALLWLITFLVHETRELYHLKQALQEVDDKIAVIYHEFFPQAVQVISPKFRINQLLKANQNQGMDRYWQLMNGLAKHWDIKEMQLEQMRFQNQTLVISLVTKDFQSLDALYAGIRKEGIQVQQKQAAMSHEKVVSTVELR